MHYTFVTEWKLRAPLSAVWDHLLHIEGWPDWWPGVLEATILTNNGHLDGVGSTIRMKWRSWLPYTLSFTLTITEVTQGVRLSATAHGDLNGTGVWEFAERDGTTYATYTWSVSTSKPWMNLVAPVARPLFAHAHHVIMRWGEQGLWRVLTARTTPAESLG